MKSTFTIILVVLLMFTGFDLSGQNLTKQIIFQDITFRIPGTWIHYEQRETYYIMAPDRQSIMIIYVGRNGNDINPTIHKVNNENKSYFISNGLSWTFNSFEGIGSTTLGSAPVKGFEAFAPVSEKNYVNVSAFEVAPSSKNQSYLKVFENILKGIEK